MASNIWLTINRYNPYPNNMNIHIINCIEYIWTNKILYNKIFGAPLDKITTML